MKNLSKKITLFMIATVVTFLGITYTLFKGTQATDVASLLVNTNFDDINFYKCVVDTYNDKNDTDYDYTTYSLSDEELASITHLYCIGDSITSAKGLEKLSSLQTLDLDENNLTELNVSQNVSLINLSVADNRLITLDVSNNINLVSLNLVLNEFETIDVSNNLELLSLVLAGNKITTLDVSNNTKLKTLNLGGKCYYAYAAKTNCGGNLVSELDLTNNVSLEILSLASNNLTNIDLVNNTNLTELDLSRNLFTDVDVSKNINLEILYLSTNQLTDVDVSNNSKLVELDLHANFITELLLDKNINLEVLNVDANKLTNLDVSNNVKLTDFKIGSDASAMISPKTGIEYPGGNKITDIDVSKNTALTDLNLSHNLLTSVDVSNNVNLKYLHIRNSKLTELDVSNNVNLIYLWVDNNYLTTLDLGNNTSISSLIINGNPFSEQIYTYKGTDVSVSNKVKIPSHLNWDAPVWSSEDTSVATVDETGVIKTFTAGSVSIVGTVSGKYTTTSTVNIVEITSDKYKIDENKNYIFIGADTDVDVIKKNINVSNINVTINVDLDNNKLQVKYVDEVLKEFKLLKINFGDYEILNKIIMLSGDTSYETFISNITKSDGITYKIFNDDFEVNSGNIEDGMILKVYYDDVVVDEYTVSKEYFKFDNSLKLDDTNMIVGNIDINTTINNLKSKINTTGEVSVYDKDNNVIEDTDSKLKTGDKIKIKLSSQEFVYTISVTGDVTGDGDITAADIQKISKHLLNGDEIVGEEYLLASDYDKDDTIDINDIVKLSKYINNSEL